MRVKDMSGQRTHHSKNITRRSGIFSSCQTCTKLTDGLQKVNVVGTNVVLKELKERYKKIFCDSLFSVLKFSFWNVKCLERIIEFYLGQVDDCTHQRLFSVVVSRHFSNWASQLGYFHLSLVVSFQASEHYLTLSYDSNKYQSAFSKF